MSWTLHELELEQVALWPSSAKWLLLGLVSALLCLSGGYFYLNEHWVQWQQALQQEAELKRTFHHKAQLAASLPAYQQQLLELEQQVASAMQQLPNQRQAATLLKDLSTLAKTHGLVLSGFQWQAERPLALATELPLQLHLQGDYHQLGQFAAEVSALPRVVVIDSLEIRRATIKPAVADSGVEFNPAHERLNMSVLATAYVYANREEGGSP
ncbi:hypothetical protein CBP31_04395 [Oceanisphaera profunda]|uniref:Pilus assembly protein PilO n=1 Tax=Oceanisphaera profunda TaxID=1416627 RepID=A0A1Y0D364_9GAMM|nr:type 4a pilus biogenesis protein PilO [Oceanisphaera profunda]ART81962.1 hypothetical protein CBP31_04395 [Oceanisphaera profunda]